MTPRRRKPLLAGTTHPGAVPTNNPRGAYVGAGGPSANFRAPSVNSVPPSQINGILPDVFVCAQLFGYSAVG